MLLRVRETLACLVLVSMGCTQEVDDPASFDSGTPPADSGGSAAETTSDQDSDSASGGNASMSAGADSSTGAPPASDSSSGGPATTGPVDDSGGPSGCGDGMVSPGEQCDGINLQGFDCGSLGLGTGTLACDPMTCTFDTSMCMGGGGGTGG